MEGFHQNDSKNEKISSDENKIEKPQVKEGVDFVFEQKPGLAEIGTKKQYSEYLDTIFSNSKIKDVVYHGTNKNSYNAILKEGFDLNKSGNNLGYMGKIASFFTEKGYTNNFENGAVVSSLINITSKYIDNSGNLTEEGLNMVKQKLVDLKVIPFVHSIEQLNEDMITNFENNVSFQNARETNRLVRYLYDTNIEKSSDLYYSIIKELNISGLKRNDVVIDMLSTDQIHVLGSNQDIENFKKFVENHQDSHA